MTTNIYNHVRLGPSRDDVCIGAAPPAVTATIENWLEERRCPESEAGVGWEVLSERRLSLLLLRHAISSDGHSLELLHVVAVPERRLTEASEEAVTGFFESLYGSPLSMALPKLLVTLAGRPRAETAARVRDFFANDTHLEALDWQDFEAPAPRAPEPREATPQERRWVGRVAAGLAMLAGAALGAGLAHFLLAAGSPPSVAAAPSPAAQIETRLGRLEQRVDRLVEQAQASLIAISELRRGQAQATSQPSQVLGASQSPPSEAVESEGASPLPAASPEEPVAAASPAASKRTFRVTALSARVRSGPSVEERTRGLVGRGQRVVVTDAQDAWLEIEPPPGFSGPAWIHRTLVEAVETASEEAASAPTTGAVGPAGPPIASRG